MLGHVNQNEPTQINEMRVELQQLMNDNVNILRTTAFLKKSEKRLKELNQEINLSYERSELSSQLLELRNMIAVSSLIVRQSLERGKNQGAFYNTDLEGVK